MSELDAFLLSVAGYTPIDGEPRKLIDMSHEQFIEEDAVYEVYNMSDILNRLREHVYTDDHLWVELRNIVESGLTKKEIREFYDIEERKFFSDFSTFDDFSYNCISDDDNFYLEFVTTMTVTDLEDMIANIKSREMSETVREKVLNVLTTELDEKRRLSLELPYF